MMSLVVKNLEKGAARVASGVRRFGRFAKV